MYDSRYIELEKLMNIINKLNKELQLVKKDINNKESKSKELVSYIEQKIKENTKSIKELENPFLLFIMGSGNYGKSTLINALLQEKVIETSDIPNTWKLDLFIKSDNEKVEITYNDEREIIKSLSNGKKILKEEEDKFKISKKEISKKILSYKNKLSKDKLKEFKIEQERLHLYKSDINQIKYYLKNKKILNDFTIVDTPGLNQTLLKNTVKRMNKYYQKSDGVIWLIDAQNIVSKETNKLIEEINKIDNLHEKKIIGVVNKIDIIKNDKDLERLKEKVNEIYNNKFNDIVYISARDALDGIVNKDKYLIDKDFKAAATILKDSIVTAVSNDHMLLTYKYESMVEDNDNEYASISNLIKQMFGSEYKVVAITDKRWKELRPYFLNLKKENGTIPLIEEKYEKINKSENMIENENYEEVLNIFDSDLIEMEE